jgi:putative peptidoglycan lipid II flippase
MLPWGLFGMSISTAVFPTLAEHAANRSMEDLRLTVARSLRYILYLTIPASIGLMLLGRPLIALLLQRGAFTLSSTQITNDALLFFALGLFALAGTEILSRGFYALGDTKTPVVFAVVAMAANLVLSAALFMPLGVRGLAIAASAAAVIEFLGLFRFLRRRLGSLEEGQLAFTISRVVLGTVFMAEALAVFLLVFRAVFGPLTITLNALIALLVCAPTGAFIFVWSTQALGAEEAHFVRSWVASRLSKLSRGRASAG